MQTDTVMHMKHFIRVNRITMTAERVDSNPNMDSREMDHWKVVFRMPFKDQQRGMSTHHTMTTYFSMGFGLKGKEPEAAEVLDCLASDASSVDQESFEEWCSSFGYDTDSRKAEKTYKACQHGAKRLKAFLGDDLYQTLLYSTERM